MKPLELGLIIREARIVRRLRASYNCAVFDQRMDRRAAPAGHVAAVPINPAPCIPYRSL